MAAKWIFPRHAVLTICMNVSRFMNLAAIFSLDLESQYKELNKSFCLENTVL